MMSCVCSTGGSAPAFEPVAAPVVTVGAIFSCIAFTEYSL